MSLHTELTSQTDRTEPDRRRSAGTRPHLSWSPIVIRVTIANDRASLERLSELDSAPRLREPSLIAERQGRAVAAISLQDRRVIADPFVRTEDVIALLRLRAAQLG